MLSQRILRRMKGEDSSAAPPHFLLYSANGGHRDRYHLCEAPGAPDPNLDNPIHPIFAAQNFKDTSPELYRNLQHSLQFASMFLQTDTMLEWFIRPIFGNPMKDSSTGRRYLSDPGRFESKRAGLIRGVRKALRCLAHSIQFEFSEGATWFACTDSIPVYPDHTDDCPMAFGHKGSIRIRIRGQYKEYLTKKYATTAKYSDNLRLDFHLALTLVHEIGHAVGVMRRGNLKEPCINLDDPVKAEFGQSWESFAFGGIINPFDRTASRICYLTIRPWANNKANEREYTAIPMSWITQWFHKSTWCAIKERGPHAVTPPPVHLVLQQRRSGYTVIADDIHALTDLKAVKEELLNASHKLPAEERPDGVFYFLAAKTVLLAEKPRAGAYIFSEPHFGEMKTTVPSSIQSPDSRAGSSGGRACTASVAYQSIQAISLTAAQCDIPRVKSCDTSTAKRARDIPFETLRTLIMEKNRKIAPLQPLLETLSGTEEEGEPTVLYSTVLNRKRVEVLRDESDGREKRAKFLRYTGRS